MKTRRKAIDCTLIRESKDHPGYFKYQVTIQELDGTTHVVPAYGKDMEDALERLVWSERKDKVIKKKVTAPILVSAWLATIVVPAIMAALTNSPAWILGALAFSIVLAISTVQMDKYFNKD